MGPVDVKVDLSAIRRSFAASRVNRAAMTAGKRVQLDLLARIIMGFDVGGWNPVTGKGGFWPKRKEPQGAAETVTQAGKKAAEKYEAGKLKKGVTPTAKQLEDAEYRGRLKALKQFSAKDRNGVTRRLRIGGKVLIDTGRYRRSITKGPVAMTGGTLNLPIGTNVPYAKYHEQPGKQGGATRQRMTAKQAFFLRKLGFTRAREGGTIKLPQRRVFVCPRPWVPEFTKIMQTELVSVLNGGANGGAQS